MSDELETLQPMKLTDWENEPTLVSLTEDYISSKSYHDSNCSKIEEWLDILNVSGSEKDRYIPKSNTKSKVQPKLVRKQNEWRYPALSEPFLNSDKIFNVQPRTFEDKDIAEQNEILLNYQFDTKLNKVTFIDELVRSTVDRGTSIVRVSWNRETKVEVKDVPQFTYMPSMDQSFIEQLNQLAQLKESNPREFLHNVPIELQESVKYFIQTGQPVQAMIIGYQQIEEEVIVENCPVLELIDPSNIYIDPSCRGNIDKALFIIHAFETNRAELQKDGRYVNLDYVDWNNVAVDSESYLNDQPNLNEFNFKDKTRKKVIAYEYWGYYDIHNNDELVPIVATWIGSTLIRMEENPFPDKKLPFVFIKYSSKVNSVYGEPDAELLKENQRILGALTRGIIDLLGKSANGQRGYAKGMLDAINERKFKAGEDYSFNAEVSPIGGGYIEHTFPEIPQSALLMLQLQNQEAESLTGIKAFSGGLSGDAYGQVAAGIKGMLDSAAKREMSILRRLAKGMVEIGNKIIAMNAEFLTEEEVIRVTNDKFITIRREDIKGNFDLKVDINTAEIDNTKAQDLAFMLQTIGPNLDPQITLFIMAEIAKLKRMPYLANLLENYKPQPDPMEEQMKQLQLQEMQAKVQKLQAEVQKISADAQQTAMDMQMEVTGAKHQQDMEKQQAQADANKELEVTKAILKPLKENEKAPNIEAAVGYNAITNSN